MIITRHFFDFAPERLPLMFSALGANTSGLMSGVSMFSGVTRVSPVQILRSMGCFLEILNQRFHAQFAHLERVLKDDAVDRPSAQPGDDRLAGVKTDEMDTFAHPAGPPAPTGRPP